MPSDYKIPSDVLDRLPERLWDVFWDGLVAVFGIDIFRNGGFTCLPGTYGWESAFKLACVKTGTRWLYEYYTELRWWDADRFNSEFSAILWDKKLSEVSR